MRTLDLNGFDTSNVKDMEYMFDGCSKLEELDLSSFDMSKVTYVYGMFRDCSNLRTIYTPKVMITGQFITLPDTFYDSEMKSVTKLALDNCNMILVKPYTINYILNGGVQNENNPLSYLLSEEDVVLFAPTHEGYQFLGWYSDAEFSEQVQIIPAGSVGDITLYAQWQKIVVDSVYIILDKTSLSMEQGSTYNLKATMEPLNTTDVVTWISSNQDVAKVSDAGVVTALSKGMAIITATTTSGKTATCTVTVNIPLTAITLNETSLSIIEGETYTLKATLTPSNSTDIITWSSSEANVAKVSTDGVVTAVKKGTAIITVTSANGVQATCKVTVKAKEIPATKIKLNKTKITINKGKTLTLKATLTPTSSTDTIKWTSSKKSIAKVTGNGKKATVTALKKGTTTITAKTSSGKKVTCKVTVKEIKATKIKLNKTKVTIKKGKSLTLKATLTPKNSTDTVTWISSSKKVAKVSNKGKVTALKKGTATITAKTSSGKKVTCKVTVK